MPQLKSFAFPANLDELSAEAADKWSDQLSETFDAAVKGSGNPKSSPRDQFYNPINKPTAADAKEASVFWTAFPRTAVVETSTRRQAWDRADKSRDVQDEYCEWSVQRNSAKKITRVTFTCETPEYWDLLAKEDESKLLELYEDFVGQKVKREDLFNGNSYRRRNKWNRDTKLGPIHMIQESNKLDAAVELAAAATIVRKINGSLVTSEQALIKCGKFGVKTRNSDPHIGAAINELARAKADVTLDDPVGLYINDFTPAGFTTPDDADPKSFWTYVRGEKGHRLRGVYEVPTERGYTVGDIRINGQPIDFGAQIAEFVSIKITGVACRIGKSSVKPFTVCA